MTIVADSKAILERYGKYIEELKGSFQRYRPNTGNLRSDLYQTLKNPDFQREAKRIGATIATAIKDRDGGKASLTIMLLIVGAFLGSIGIAGFGNAIGVPLAVVLGIVGLVFGHELDGLGGPGRFLHRLREWFFHLGNNSRSSGKPDAAEDPPQATGSADIEALLSLHLDLSDNVNHLARELTEFQSRYREHTERIEVLEHSLAESGRKFKLLQWMVAALGLLIIVLASWVVIH